MLWLLSKADGRRVTTPLTDLSEYRFVASVQEILQPLRYDFRYGMIFGLGGDEHARGSDLKNLQAYESSRPIKP